jgi:hypothetical protein
MSFITDIIYKARQQYKQNKNLQQDIKAKVSSGEIKKLADVRKKYERGSTAYKIATNQLTNEMVERQKEEVIYKQKLKEAKNIGQPNNKIGIKFGKGLASVINREDSNAIKPKSLDFGGGSGLQFGGSDSPFKKKEGMNGSPFK